MLDRSKELNTTEGRRLHDGASKGSASPDVPNHKNVLRLIPDRDASVAQSFRSIGHRARCGVSGEHADLYRRERTAALAELSRDCRSVPTVDRGGMPSPSIGLKYIYVEEITRWVESKRMG